MLIDIRRTYGVPAHLNSHIKLATSEGVVTAKIVGSRGGKYLKVMLEDGTIRLCHPTFGVTYE